MKESLPRNCTRAASSHKSIRSSLFITPSYSSAISGAGSCGSFLGRRLLCCSCKVASSHPNGWKSLRSYFAFCIRCRRRSMTSSSVIAWDPRKSPCNSRSKYDDRDLKLHNDSFSTDHASKIIEVVAASHFASPKEPQEPLQEPLNVRRQVSGFSSL